MTLYLRVARFAFVTRVRRWDLASIGGCDDAEGLWENEKKSLIISKHESAIKEGRENAWWKQNDKTWRNSVTSGSDHTWNSNCKPLFQYLFQNKYISFKIRNKLRRVHMAEVGSCLHRGLWWRKRSVRKTKIS